MAGEGRYGVLRAKCVAECVNGMPVYKWLSDDLTEPAHLQPNQE